MCCNTTEPTISISYNNSGDYTLIGKATSLNVSQSTDKNEITSFDSGRFKEYCPGRTEASVSFDVIGCYNDPGQRILSLAQRNSDVPVYFKVNYVQGDGAEEFYFKAFPETADISKGAAGESITRSYTLAVSDFVVVDQRSE